MPVSTEALLIRPFAEPDRAALARIYARAFPDKLAAMLDGHVAAGPAIMTALVEPADTWVAVRDGAPVGVVCVKDEERPAPGHPLWRVLRRHLPPPAAARAWLHSWLIHTVSVGPDCLYLDYVAVEPAAQGEGVGGALLELVIDEARRRGKTSVGLYVIDRNRAARRLYERHGFVALRSEHLRLFRRVAGFRWSEFMELRLDDGCQGGARGGAEPLCGECGAESRRRAVPGAAGDRGGRDERVHDAGPAGSLVGTLCHYAGAADSLVGSLCHGKEVVSGLCERLLWRRGEPTGG